jgi:hypothetical protein
MNVTVTPAEIVFLEFGLAETRFFLKEKFERQLGQTRRVTSGSESQFK